MSIRLQLILICALVVIFILLVNAVKKNNLDIKYSLGWLLLVVVLIVLTCFKDLLEIMADVMGIASPVNMLFLCGFVVALLIIYTLTVALSKISSRVRRLAQEIAFLSNEINELKEENKKMKEHDTDIDN